MADTKTIFNSSLIDLDRLREFWAKAKEYIDATDGGLRTDLDELSATLTALSTKHDAHETEFNTHETEFINYKNETNTWKGTIDDWKGTVDAHMNTNDGGAGKDIHVSSDDRTAWNKAAKDIHDFLNAEDIKEGVIDTLKEIQSYIETDASDAAELVNRVGALETTTGKHGGRLDTIEAALNATNGSIGNIAEAITAAVKAHNESDEAHADRFAAIDEEIDDIIKDYATIQYVDNQVSGAKTYAEGQAATAITTANGYTDEKVDEINESIKNITTNYATKGELTTEVGNLNAAISAVDKKVDTVDAKFANHYTKAEVYTKEECNETFATKSDLNGVDTKVDNITTNYATKTYAEEQADAAELAAKGYTDSELAKYYKKTETYTQTEVDTAVNGAKTAANEYTDGEFSKLTLATTAEVEGLFA